MSIAALILGESGTGKSTSLRNLDPDKTLLIQIVKKPLPFRAKGWSYRHKETNPNGNIFHSDNATHILMAMQRTDKEIIVIDDFQYLMVNELFAKIEEKGFDKFTSIAKNARDVLTMANNLPDNKRVYILSHTESNESGKTKIKTIGKMLDEKLTPEGLLAITMRTAVINEGYYFSTRNNGNDTVKTPMGMFNELHIDNDLAAVDATIIDYYQLNQQSENENELNP